MSHLCNLLWMLDSLYSCITKKLNGGMLFLLGTWIHYLPAMKNMQNNYYRGRIYSDNISMTNVCPHFSTTYIHWNKTIQMQSYLANQTAWPWSQEPQIQYILLLLASFAVIQTRALFTLPVNMLLCSQLVCIINSIY